MTRTRIAQPSARFDKDAVRRDLVKLADERRTKKIAELREVERAAKKARDDATREALRACRARAAANLEEAERALTAAELRKRDFSLRELAELGKALRKAKRDEARDVCHIEANAARAEKNAAALLATKLREAEVDYRAEQRRATRTAIERAKAHRRASSRERQEESDDEVRANIEPGLLKLWGQVRRSIKGSARESRTEQFLRYVEEHPEETAAAQEAPGDEDFARQEAAHRGAPTASVKVRARRRSLSAVPF